MPSITINGKLCEFTPGQVILQVANENAVEIPQYCYHDGLSIVASCRICLGEIWAPNPKNENKLEPLMGGKLVPTCQTACADGWVVYTDSPRAVQNQKAVMEYLLINHPLDCPVCDQSGECFLQDYSYQYGRSASRFQETKVKQPKKDLGNHIYLYSDRCIMCTRCVRFTREVTGTAELLVQGRGNKEEIDVFPGMPINNELSANVVDLCPVGALLEKDFLFAQRVWFLKEAPSIDGVTASGDNISIHHNEGKVYRIKPRKNMAVNKWWISDEVRYGWKHVHSEERLSRAMTRQHAVQIPVEYGRALRDAFELVSGAAKAGRRVALAVSPMLSCEDAFMLARAVRAIAPGAILGVGPVPFHGEDKLFPPGNENGYKVWAEKAPNARGVRRVLAAINGGPVFEFDAWVRQVAGNDVGAVVLTGNYPSAWASDELVRAIGESQSQSGKAVVLIDTLESRLVGRADVVLPSVTWVEKSGTFQNGRDMLQAFEQAIMPLEGAHAEARIGIDLYLLSRGETPGAARRVDKARAMQEAAPGGFAVDGPAARALAHAQVAQHARSGDEAEGGPMSLDLHGRDFAELMFPREFDAAAVRELMAEEHADLRVFVEEVAVPVAQIEQRPDMQMVEL